ncbi:MAG: hypothetical protein EBZ44_00420 [Verrucomicrobia bacterium]|nr:hypothetical protein [Verrucomicrobiota bacterium]
MPLKLAGWRGGAAWAAGLWLVGAMVGWSGTQVYVVEPGKPESGLELLLVEKEAAKDGTSLLVEPGGSEKKISTDKIVARLTPAPGRGTQVDRKTAVAAINALLEAKAKAAALERTLQEEVEKWKKILDQLPSEQDPEALKKAEAAFAEALSKAMPKPYDPAGSYSREELAAQLAALEEVRKTFPGRAEEIDRQAEPWRVEQSEMTAGKKKLEGRWLSPEEWEKEKGARQKAAREAFLAKLEIPEAPPVLIGQGIFLAAAGMVLVAGFLGASFLFHGILEFIRHRAWWKGTAWTLAGAAIIAVLGRATGLALSAPEPLAAGNSGNAENIEEIFWQQGGQKKSFPKELKASDADLNAWFTKRLRFSPLKVTEIAVLAAESWKLDAEDGTLRLDRTGRFFGRTLVLRHEMTFNRTEKGEDIYRIEAVLGQLPLPPALVLRSWNQWTETLAKMTAAMAAAEHVTLERIEKGAVVFSGK